MKHLFRLCLFALAAAAFSPTPAAATITFTQLDDELFVVSHRVKVIGSRGKATRMVYTKAASLCHAAGYTHYKVLDQESEASQEYQAANASLRVRFYLADGEERIDCASNADPEYVAEARAKLAKRGYTPPDPASAPPPAPTAAAPAGAVGNGTCPVSCSLEQIAAMARAGLDDDKIRAACAGSG